jgi:hypothetical protein
MAFLRRLQQSSFVQLLAIPALITFGGSTIIALLAFSNGNLFNLTMDQLKQAIGAGGFAGLAYAAGIYQHGLGSASFKPDGTPNKVVENVVAITNKAAQEPDNPKAVDALQKVTTLAAVEAPTKP